MLGQPSVIARLMGMEDHHRHTTATAIVHASGGTSTTTISLLKPSSQAEQPKCGPLGAHHGRRIGGEYYRYCLNKMNPRRRRARRDRRPRQHPQEELLEQIKEDFRASWQLASTASPPLGTEEEEEGVVTSGRRSGGRVAGLLDGRCIQRIAQENLRREKLARYGYGGRQSSVEGEEEGVKPLVVRLEKSDEEAEQRHGGSEVSSSEEFSGEHDQMSTTSSEKPRGVPATRIAILRPATGATLGAAGDDRNAVPTPSWKAVRDGGMDMEDFLREVKHRAERLKDEMKAKTDGPGEVVAKARRGWGSVGDGPERTAQDTARQIREAVGKRLSRLESFRVFRGDRGRRDGAAASPSPEHRMLRSVMARTEAMSPTKTTGRGPRGSRWSPLRAGAGVNDRQSPDRDPRRSPAKLPDDGGVDFVAASPRALLRSFSAPAAGCYSEASSEGEQKTVGRSRSFSIFRGTVASLRQSLCLGGGAGKLLLMHLSRKKPSSPASPRQNFVARLAPPSPVSPLEVSGGRHFSGDLNCTFLTESSPRWSPRCSSEFEASVGGGESPWEWKADAAAESDDPDTAYVREVLVAAGLFDDDDHDAAAARTDSIAISDDVFEEVEDGYYYRRLRRRDDGAGEEEELGAADRRRLLFDLANEALLAGASRAVSSSSPSCLRRWVVECNNGAPSSARLRGRELEDEVWRHVARATADGTAESEVGRSPWAPEALCGDACAVGRKVERAIFDELVGDVVRQLFV